MRAAKLLEDEGIQIEPELRAALGRSVGIGAVKYADLSQNRLSDYRFDWDKLISLKGNSGPAEGASRRTRLALCWLTARQLERGLGLLGIDARDRM